MQFKYLLLVLIKGYWKQIDASNELSKCEKEANYIDNSWVIVTVINSSKN